MSSDIKMSTVEFSKPRGYKSVNSSEIHAYHLCNSCKQLAITEQCKTCDNMVCEGCDCSGCRSYFDAVVNPLARVLMASKLF